MNMPWMDLEDLTKLVFRTMIDLSIVSIIVFGVYNRIYKRRDYVFTYMLFNVITFMLCYLLRKVPIELGFALGLFAVFGILRYRTEPIRTRDLTYMFIVIGIAIVNAVANKKVSLAELLFVNLVIVGLTIVLEYGPRRLRVVTRSVLYDRVDLLTPDREPALYEDLERRLGRPVVRVDVNTIDLLRDSAQVTVVLRAGPNASAAASEGDAA